MDGWVRVLRPFNSISVISPPAGFEPATPWSEVGSANRSATRTLPFLMYTGMAMRHKRLAKVYKSQKSKNTAKCNFVKIISRHFDFAIFALTPSETRENVY